MDIICAPLYIEHFFAPDCRSEVSSVHFCRTLDVIDVYFFVLPCTEASWKALRKCNTSSDCLIEQNCQAAAIATPMIDEDRTPSTHDIS